MVTPSGAAGSVIPKGLWRTSHILLLVSVALSEATASIAIDSVKNSTTESKTAEKSKEAAAVECLKRTRTIVENNSPELLVLPNEEQLSAFATSRLHVKVDWSHIDALIESNGDKWCVGTYLVEYGPHKYHQNNGRHRGKRESVSNSADVSPSLGRDVNSWTLVVEDNCQVRSVHLVLIPAVVVPVTSMQASHQVQGIGVATKDDNGGSYNFMTSGQRRFWPAAYRTVLDVFSNSAVVSWTPVCSYATEGWVLEACPDAEVEAGDDVDTTAKNKCQSVPLNGESPVHITDLSPCRLYRFRLKAGDDLLWTFSAARTLPSPEIEATPADHSIKLTIIQGGHCDDKAIVKYWRVSHCASSQSNFDNDPTPSSSSKSDSGSGDYYDYYDHEDNENEEMRPGDEKLSTQTSMSCINNLHTVDRSRGVVLIDRLEACTLYSIDVSPADSNGHALQPGEQIGSVHSTLCRNQPKTTSSDNSDIWINENPEGNKDISTLSSDGGNGVHRKEVPTASSPKGHLTGFHLGLVVLGGAGGVAFIMALTVYAWRWSTCSHHNHTRKKQSHHEHNDCGCSGWSSAGGVSRRRQLMHLGRSCIANIQHFIVNKTNTSSTFAQSGTSHFNSYREPMSPTTTTSLMSDTGGGFGQQFDSCNEMQACPAGGGNCECCCDDECSEALAADGGTSEYCRFCVSEDISNNSICDKRRIPHHSSARRVLLVASTSDKDNVLILNQK